MTVERKSEVFLELVTWVCFEENHVGRFTWGGWLVGGIQVIEISRVRLEIERNWGFDEWAWKFIKCLKRFRRYGKENSWERTHCRMKV